MSYLRDGAKMLEEMAVIRTNSLLGRYEAAIAAMTDTSRMITPQVSVSPGAKVSLQDGLR